MTYVPPKFSRLWWLNPRALKRRIEALHAEQYIDNNNRRIIQLECDAALDAIAGVRRERDEARAMTLKNQRRTAAIVDAATDYLARDIPSDLGIGMFIEIPEAVVNERNSSAYVKFIGASMLRIGEKLALDGKTMRDWYFTTENRIAITYKDRADVR